MELELVCVSRDRTRRAVVVDIEPERRVGELARVLGCHKALYSGSVALPDWLPLSGADITNGSVLGLDVPPPVHIGSAVGGGARELAVVGGLHGGPRTTLYPVGPTAVGRSPDADLVLADAEVSRRHARVVVLPGEGGVRLEDMGSHNGVQWRGHPLRGTANLVSGDVVELGETAIGLREVVGTDAELTPVPERGEIIFHRPPERVAPTASGAELSARLRDPDPTYVLSVACAPSSRLWERRRADPDFLRLRLGLHDRPADVRMQFTEPAPMLYAVPVTVNLGQIGALGLAGPRAALLASSRALVAQAAVLRGPDDLAVALITGPESAADWEWFGWLPHTRPRSTGFDCSRLVATDAAQARTRLSELRELVVGQHGGPRSAGPRVLVVLDGVRRLHGLPGLSELLANGPSRGVATLCLEQDVRSLPPACGAILNATNDTGSRAELRCNDRPTVPDMLVDGLLADHAMRLALALAPVVQSGEHKPTTHRRTEHRAVRPRLITELGRPIGIAPRVTTDITGPMTTSVLGQSSQAPVTQRKAKSAHVSQAAAGSVDR